MSVILGSRVKGKEEKLGGGQGEFLPHVLIDVSFDSLNTAVSRTRGGRVVFYFGFAGRDIESS